MILMMMMKIDIPGSAHAASTWGLTIHILFGCSLQLHTQSASGQTSLQTVAIAREPVRKKSCRTGRRRRMSPWSAEECFVTSSHLFEDGPLS
jgi:hypothetical protein